jgi:putative SOS response-associated peptidase YedK
MCGRYQLTLYPYFDVDTRNKKNAGPRFTPKKSVEAWRPSYNVSPTHQVLVVRKPWEVEPLKWGFRPGWAKKDLINARGEEVLEKRTWKEDFLNRRCVFLMNGFFEWHPTTRIPSHFTFKDGRIFLVGGVWQKGDPETCVLFTVPSNELVSKVHDRQPLIFTEEEALVWMDPKNNGKPEPLMQLVQTRNYEGLISQTISKDIAKPANNYPELLNPVEYT